MAEFAARPKVVDVVVLCGTFCSMGASQVYPHLNQTVGFLLFYGGLAGMILYPAWRWGLHYANLVGLPAVRLPSGRVLLQDAAVAAYEELENNGLEQTLGKNFPSQKEVLKQCKFILIYSLDDVKLFGMRPPSRKSREIPRGELKELWPSDDGSELLPRYPGSGTGYREVTISRRDARRALNEHMALERRNAARREACA
jgi:hypothetical protein